MDDMLHGQPGKVNGRLKTKTAPLLQKQRLYMQRAALLKEMLGKVRPKRCGVAFKYVEELLHLSKVEARNASGVCAVSDSFERVSAWRSGASLHALTGQLQGQAGSWRLHLRAWCNNSASNKGGLCTWVSAAHDAWLKPELFVSAPSW